MRATLLRSFTRHLPKMPPFRFSAHIGIQQTLIVSPLSDLESIYDVFKTAFSALEMLKILAEKGGLLLRPCRDGNHAGLILLIGTIRYPTMPVRSSPTPTTEFDFTRLKSCRSPLLLALSRNGERGRETCSRTFHVTRKRTTLY